MIIGIDIFLSHLNKASVGRANGIHKKKLCYSPCFSHVYMGLQINYGKE